MLFLLCELSFILPVIILIYNKQSIVITKRIRNFWGFSFSAFFFVIILMMGKLDSFITNFTSFNVSFTIKIILIQYVLIFSYYILTMRKWVSLSLTNKKFIVVKQLIFLLAIILNIALYWSLNRFPLKEPDIVIFTLLFNLSGTDSNLISEIFLSVFIPSLIFFGIINISILITKKRYFVGTSQQELCIVFNNSKQTKITTNLSLIIIFISSFLLFFIFNIPIKEYVREVKETSNPAINSDFYIENYVYPAKELITFPESKKNLIVIFLESMESSFADSENQGFFYENYIPNLTKLANDNINFSHTNALGGGIDATRTGWTVAGMLSKFGAVPFSLPINGNSNNLNTFLPSLITLTDILSYENYNQRFIFGSDKSFASRDKLLEDHGNVEIHDINWYKENNYLEKKYNVFWGFEDKLLYEFAKKELEELSSKNSPFFLGFLTTDTHFPNGYQCSLCDENLLNAKFPVLNSFKCADNQIFDFIEWAKTQEWYQNTSIVIMGDHLFMDPSDNSLFESNLISKKNIPTTNRRWINIFINSSLEISAENEKNRTFSSFDMFPTILSSLGCDINGDSLGFGRSLFSGEPTIYEKYDTKYVNLELSKKTIQYESFY